MEVTTDDLLIYVNDAFDQMLRKAESLDDRVAAVPDLPGANSVYALITHCVGVCRWWTEHIVLGMPSNRDRDGEFTASGTVDELRRMVDGLRADLDGHRAAIDAAIQPADIDGATETAEWRNWSWSVGGILTHVIEELYQHAGHVDITADLLK